MVGSVAPHLLVSFTPAIHRSVDIEALLGVINSAHEFVYVAVMDYFPASIYSKKHHFWPVIDDAIRKGF